MRDGTCQKRNDRLKIKSAVSNVSLILKTKKERPCRWLFCFSFLSAEVCFQGGYVIFKMHSTSDTHARKVWIEGGGAKLVEKKCPLFFFHQHYLLFFFRMAGSGLTRSIDKRKKNWEGKLDLATRLLREKVVERGDGKNIDFLKARKLNSFGNKKFLHLSLFSMSL